MAWQQEPSSEFPGVSAMASVVRGGAETKSGRKEEVASAMKSVWASEVGPGVETRQSLCPFRVRCLSARPEGRTGS